MNSFNNTSLSNLNNIFNTVSKTEGATEDNAATPEKTEESINHPQQESYDLNKIYAEAMALADPLSSKKETNADNNLIGLKYWKYTNEPLATIPEEEKIEDISVLEQHSFEYYMWGSCSLDKFYNKISDFLTYINFNNEKNIAFREKIKTIIMSSITNLDAIQNFSEYELKSKKLKILKDLNFINDVDFEAGIAALSIN